MPKSAPVSLEALAAPVKAVSELSLRSLEKLAGLQVATAEGYVSLGLEYARAVSALQAPEGLKKLPELNSATAKRIADKLVADAKEFARLATEYGQGVQKIATTPVAA